MGCPGASHDCSEEIILKIYKNANVFYGKNFELIPNASIVVSKGRIVEVTEKKYENGTDLHGDYVIPAFIDSHCHLGDTGAKELGIGLTLEEAVVYPNGLKHKYLASITEEELTETIRCGMIEMLRHGIAVAADYREGGVNGVKALVNAGRELPIHVLALGRPACPADAEDREFEREIWEILEISDGFGMGRLEAVSGERMKLIRRLARDKLFSIHISEGREDDIRSKKLYGKSEVERALEFEADFMVHLTHTDGKDIRLLKEHGVNIVCCPRTNLIIGDGFPELDMFTDAGISWGIGTDNMMFTNPDMFREMDTASRVVRGMTEKPDCMPADECLKAAALGGAKALKIDDMYGTIEKGKSASFVAVKADSENFRFSHNIKSGIIHRAGPSDIDYFILDGTEVTEAGEFLF